MAAARPALTPGEDGSAGAAVGPWANELHAQARPLIVLATQLAAQLVADPSTTRNRAVAAIRSFEAKLGAAGLDERATTVASYLLCCWLDQSLDAAAGVPAGSLLHEFHAEAAGAARLYPLLERLLQLDQLRPGSERPLLELAYVCLSLGLQSSARDAAKREAVRARLAQRLALAPAAGRAALSRQWPVAVPPRSAANRVNLGIAAILALVLAAAGVFGSSQWLLARQSAAIFESLQSLEQRAGAAPANTARATATPGRGLAPARLAQALSGQSRSQGFEVRDEVHRSVITWDAGDLFEVETARLNSARANPLRGVAEALAAATAQSDGRVLVTAYAAADAPRPARLASAADLADAWAQQVAQALQPRLAPASLAFEGRTEAARGPGASLGRVEISLFP